MVFVPRHVQSAAVKGAEEEDGSEVDEMDVETNSAGDARNLTDRQLLSQILANPTQYLPSQPPPQPTGTIVCGTHKAPDSFRRRST